MRCLRPRRAVGGTHGVAVKTRWITRIIYAPLEPDREGYIFTPEPTEMQHVTREAALDYLKGYAFPSSDLKIAHVDLFERIFPT